jgi:hypothetical protein
MVNTNFDEKHCFPVFGGETRFFSTIFVPLILKDSSRFQIFFLHFEGWEKPWKYSFSIKMPP